ncbi:MAG: 23S rRNA (guanosine(2251)-2'-O)-methyltransferase RlmB [Methylovirgula sp.]
MRKKPNRREAAKYHGGEKPEFKPYPAKAQANPQAHDQSKPQGHAHARSHGPDKRPAKVLPPFRRASAQVALLYGFHAVHEALRTKKRRPLALFATEAAAARLAEDCATAGLVPQIVEAEDLSRKLGPEAVHQGVLLEAEPLPARSLDEIESKSGVVLVLDQITDPHNVGAIVRSAAAFGVDALVTTERHAPEFTGLLAKAASGGLEHVAIVHVVNLARALEELGELGYLRIGLDSEAPAALEEAPLTRPLALVLGAEDKGLRRLTRERCDLLARLDMPGAIKSLNVSNACAVALALARTRLASSSS